MNRKQSHHPARAAQRAFTLLELLAVMAIMAILLAVTLPSVQGVAESNNITQGGQSFADQVALARQTASSRNITVQVRCINVPNRSQIGYSAVQLWSINSGLPIFRGQNLPDGIAISQDTTTFSTLFGSYVLTGTMPTGGAMGGDSYVSFTVNPSGMVGPLSSGGTAQVAPNMTALSVGVVPARLASTTSISSVKNYMLIQLNPLTAATLNYRP